MSAEATMPPSCEHTHDLHFATSPLALDKKVVSAWWKQEIASFEFCIATFRTTLSHTSPLLILTLERNPNL